MSPRTSETDAPRHVASGGEACMLEKRLRGSPNDGLGSGLGRALFEPVTCQKAAVEATQVDQRRLRVGDGPPGTFEPFESGGHSGQAPGAMRFRGTLRLSA